MYLGDLQRCRFVARQTSKRKESSRRLMDSYLSPTLVLEAIVRANSSGIPFSGPGTWLTSTEGQCRELSSVRYWRRIQPVNATHWLNLSAGVWKPSVLRGLSFNCLAIALSCKL